MNKLSATLQWTIALATVVIGAVLSLSITINDHALDLLPDSAIRGDLQLLEKLGLVNRIILTLSIDDESQVELLKKSTLALGDNLKESGYYANVIYHLPEKFTGDSYHYFQSQLPLFLDRTDLKRIEPLLTASGISTTLQNCFNLLNSPAGYGLKNQIRNDPLGITSFVLQKLKYLRAEYSLQVEDGLFLSKDRKNTLIVAESKKSLIDADSAKIIQTQLNASLKKLAPEITPRIIGSLPHTLANADSVKHDLKMLLPIATILLLCLLLAALRSLRALFVLILPFFAAPPAIYVTSLFFGEVSSLALGFGIVLLGIAVDFAIHLYLGLSSSSDRKTFQKNIFRPIFLATVTTSSVFIVLLFSEVPSHRQMATLALTGILLAVCYSWFLIPSITPKSSTIRPLPFTFSPISHSSFGRWSILLLWISLLLFGGWSWSALKYNGNLQTLDVPNKAVMEDEKSFRKVWGDKGDQAFMVASAPTLDEALELNSVIFKKLVELDAPSFQSLAPLLPSLADQRRNLAGWHAFWQEHQADFQKQFVLQAQQFGFTEEAFSPFFNSLHTDISPRSLLETLPGTLKIIADAMIRLPQQQKGNNNEYLITTTITTDDDQFRTLLEMEKNQKGITLLGNKKWRDQVEKQLRSDILVLSCAAAAIIALIIFLSFHRLRTVIAVLAPVLSALAAMAIFSAMTGKELNMMHLLMGIMIIGLAVDYGIFAVYSVEGKSTHRSFFAISICALSSLIGFGVLSFAQHPALHSLGITVLIGIGAAWPTAILVSPAILRGGKYASGGLQ